MTLPLFGRPTIETLDRGRLSVQEVARPVACEMMRQHHYTHKSGATKFAYGLYLDGELIGALTLGTVYRPNAEAICGIEYGPSVLELTRLFVHDVTPRNTESFFLGRVFAALERDHKDVCILLSYADSAAGHLGYIYQATNWLYTGASRHQHYELANGTTVHSRSTYDGHDKGASMADFWKNNPGAKSVRGKPKHRYVYFLGTKAERKALRKALRWPILPYPKSV